MKGLWRRLEDQQGVEMVEWVIAVALLVGAASVAFGQLQIGLSEAMDAIASVLNLEPI